MVNIEILRLNAQSFLSHFQDEPGLNLEKIGGHYIWFAANTETRDCQRQGRSAQEHAQHMALPSDREAVMILVDLLHHPDTEIADIVRRLNSKNIAMTPETIRVFLVHHDLLKKTTAPVS